MNHREHTVLDVLEEEFGTSSDVYQTWAGVQSRGDEIGDEEYYILAYVPLKDLMLRGDQIIEYTSFHVEKHGFLPPAVRTNMQRRLQSIKQVLSREFLKELKHEPLGVTTTIGVESLGGKSSRRKVRSLFDEAKRNIPIHVQPASFLDGVDALKPCSDDVADIFSTMDVIETLVDHEGGMMELERARKQAERLGATATASKSKKVR